MGQFADALRRLQQNPDDLSDLPQLIAQVEQVEDSVTTYQQNISTLQDINKKYGTTVARLAKSNGIKNKNVIYVGQVLKV